MRISLFSTKRIPAYLLCIALLLVSITKLHSQAAWESRENEVYHFLYRMAQKGLVVYNDNIRPLSRVYLQQCLDSLEARQNQLSAIEKKELQFYLKEYTDLTVLQKSDSTDHVHFLQTDSFGRARFLYYHSNKFLFRLDPVFTGITYQGQGQHITHYSSLDFNAYGYFGKHWAYYLSLNDVNEKGTGLDTARLFTPLTGFSTKISTDGKSQNYSELRAGISYSWKNGSLSFGQDQLSWGYSENGGIVLSSKAPNYPYLRLDYQPLSWLRFNYVHAWLNSNLIDSAASYRTGVSAYGGQRIIYINKYMAMHSLQVTPAKGWDISVGESIIYSDRLEAGYLIPVMFFKVYDNLINNNNINAGSNGQLFLQVSSRNHPRNTHFYGTLFIDEIRLGAVFDKIRSRNQLGFTLGGSVTDFVLPYTTVGLEYTRINPFVYRNLLPAQNYTNNNYTLGDWMGNNSDRLIAYLKYTPLPKLKCLLRYQYIRKGGPGTYDQQYFQQPQPSFLFDLQRKQQELLFQASYEWLNKLYFTGYISSLNTNDFITGLSSRQNTLSIGLTYGL